MTSIVFEVNEEDNIRIKDSLNVEQLVRDVFVKGSCVSIDNIQQLGPDQGIGYFENGINNIGIERGIVLASGEVRNARGPNQSKHTTGKLNSLGTDSDLSRIATGPLFDIMGIEFDFTSQKETVSFRYVFASEEYCEFVGSIFNDVFGFFVSGPGINGPFQDNAIQVALLPESDEYVSINNVNHEVNTQYYVKNETLSDTRVCNIPYGPKHLDEIEYDGFTTVLTATFKVIPCETYRMRLLVCDVNDEILDSAVFLEAKSFDIGPEAEIEFITEEPGSNQLVEACGEGQLIVRRTGNLERDKPLEVNYFIDQQSTSATEGVDFESLPRRVTIPAFSDSVIIPIRALADGIPEDDIEHLVIELEYPCICPKPDRTEIIFSDQLPLNIDVQHIDACLGQSVAIQPTFAGGKPPYTYLWDNGSTESTRTISEVQGVDVFSVTVNDDCGATLSSIIELGIKEPPVASMGGIYDWCASEKLLIPVDLTGNPPFQLQYVINGSVEEVDSILESPYFLPVSQPGEIQLSGFRDATCQGIVQGGAEVLGNGMEVSYTVTPLACPTIPTGEIRLNIRSNYPYTVEWDSTVIDPLHLTGLAPGNYAVLITNTSGCQVREIITVRNPTPEEIAANNCPKEPISAQIYIPNAFSPDNDGQNDQFRVYFKDPASLSVKEFQIFDRWGALLYRATSTEAAAWDGTFKGYRSSAGIYIYSILVEDPLGNEKLFSGSVVLVR